MKETKSTKSFKRKVAKIYLDSYANYICKKTVYHVDKLSLYNLLHPVVHKHDSNSLCYPLFQPLCLKCTMYIVFIVYSGPTN